jgi:4-hydroxy-tetrahydrodipicolinate reductase
MTKVVVSGAFGRMGSMICRMVTETEGLELVGGIGNQAGTQFNVEVVTPGEIDRLLSEKQPDVLIDFTVASAAVTTIQAAARHHVALVVGTTGFSDAQQQQIRDAVEGTVPAVISTNFSIGVTIFWQILRNAAPLLSEYDIEVSEAHHRYKKDAPSGTAKTILSILDEAVGEREKVYGREGVTERQNEIGVHVFRGGDIVGDHAVTFAKNFESITLSHRAHDRAVLVKGALKAAAWVPGKQPGIYPFSAVLGLES